MALAFMCCVLTACVSIETNKMVTDCSMKKAQSIAIKRFEKRDKVCRHYSVRALKSDSAFYVLEFTDICSDSFDPNDSTSLEILRSQMTGGGITYWMSSETCKIIQTKVVE